MTHLFQLAPVAFVIFILTIVTSLYALYGNQQLIRSLALHPYSIARKKKIYTLITSGLVHAHMPHLLLNMFSYFFFAFTLEQIIGHWQFLLLYLCGLLLSDLTTLYKQRDHPYYFSLGASGAISAVIFSYILFDPFSKIYLFLIPIGIPAFLFAILYLAYCMYAARNQSDQVNHEAHFWGAVSGILTTLLLYPGILDDFLRHFSH